MSAAAHPQSAPVPAPRRALHGGLVIFLISEAMFFTTVLATRFVLAGGGHPGSLDQPLAVVVTAALLASVVPARAVRRAVVGGQERVLGRALASAAAAGAVALALVVVEIALLSLPADTRYGGIFYLTVVLHALHVLGGTLIFAGLAVAARRGRFAAGQTFAAEGAVLFWEFVVATWVAVWIVLYLL